MKLVIDRSKWLRGEGTTNSALLRKSDGKMCCLGFLALAVGATENDITGITSPSWVCQINWPEGMVIKDIAGGIPLNQGITSSLMTANDDRRITDAEREDELTELFTKLGIEVEFFN